MVVRGADAMGNQLDFAGTIRRVSLYPPKGKEPCILDPTSLLANVETTC